MYGKIDTLTPRTVSISGKLTGIWRNNCNIRHLAIVAMTSVPTPENFGHANGDARRLNVVGLLFVAAVVLTVAFVLFMALETARRIDTATAERAKAEEYSLWNDAVDHLVVDYDGVWANANVGPYAERLWGAIDPMPGTVATG